MQEVVISISSKGMGKQMPTAGCQKDFQKKTND